MEIRNNNYELEIARGHSVFIRDSSSNEEVFLMWEDLSRFYRNILLCLDDYSDDLLLDLLELGKLEGRNNRSSSEQKKEREFVC